MGGYSRCVRRDRGSHRSLRDCRWLAQCLADAHVWKCASAGWLAGSTFARSGERATYRLGFKGLSPDLPNAPSIHDPDQTAGDNVPFSSSPVLVYPNYPPVCGVGSMPTWLVRATSLNSPGTMLQVGTLHKQATARQSPVHEGQYSMPFEMLIEALKCFPY